MALIPPLEATGLYTLAAPYNSVMKPNVSYTCMAIRKLSDIIAQGLDPYEVYYSEYDLQEADYARDLAANACMISLQATDGSWIHVSSTYILAYPDVNGVPYNHIILAVSLGAVPDAMDLSYIRNKLMQDITSVLGITPTITTVVASAKTLVGQDNHLAAEAARQNNITSVNTDYSENLALRTQNAALLTKVTELENYIRSQLQA